MDQRPEEANNEKKGERGGLPELLKRAVLAGIGALALTEEGARSLLGELKLPKEAAQFVLNQVGKTKEDLFRMISREVRSFLESIDLADEFRKVLANTSLEISTTVRFVPHDDKLSSEADTRIKVRPAPRKSKKASEQE